MLVAVIERVRTQRRVDVVHQRDIGGVVQAAAVRQQAGLRQQFFGALMPGFGQQDLMRLLIDTEIARPVLLGLAA